MAFGVVAIAVLAVIVVGLVVGFFQSFGKPSPPPPRDSWGGLKNYYDRIRKR
jgi:hypothetical protein